MLCFLFLNKFIYIGTPVAIIYPSKSSSELQSLSIFRILILGSDFVIKMSKFSTN
ncbi:hypothetical protein SAMN02982990_03125 [Photorhabdus luminescens]|uniref:Uncharacterized protein n=1 Tax=Photorhabdus luminescens TaxID=29488 RepID=A0A1G5R4Q7_PHOLU|nr:hypothetical protein SAMN02982990_03125 [Photorhabdus luminescens]